MSVPEGVSDWTDEADLLTKLLEHPAGWGAELFADLTAHRLEDGRFSVTEDGKGEELFGTAREAAERLVGRRRDRKLGMDFEAGGKDEAREGAAEGQDGPA